MKHWTLVAVLCACAPSRAGSPAAPIAFDDRPHPNLAYFPVPLPADRYPSPSPAEPVLPAPPLPSCAEIGFDLHRAALLARLDACRTVARASDPCVSASLVIAFDVDETGATSAVRVVRSNATTSLEGCVVEAVVQTTFAQARDACRSRFELPIDFLVR